MGKSGGGGASKKQIEKKKKQIVEDKTFGLKNKGKSKVVQQYVQKVTSQADAMGKQLRGNEKELEARRAAKEEKKLFQAEMKVLFKPSGGAGKTMILPSSGKNAFRGEEAVVEEKKVVKEQKEYLVYEEEERTLEQELEEERAKLPEGGTPVTLETFKAWKAKKEAEKAAKEDEVKKQQAALAAKGKKGASGRSLFEIRPEMFVDDADAAEEYERAEDEDVYDIQATGTSITVTKKEDKAAADDLGVAVQESLFLDDDGDLPDDLPDELEDLDDEDGACSSGV